MGLTKDLLENFEEEIETLALLPSDGGRFEVAVNGKLVYSKLSMGRHAEAGEVVNLISKIVK